MQKVVCCNHARMRSSAGKSTQSHLSQQCAAVKATVGCVCMSGKLHEQEGESRYACICPGRVCQSVCGCVG